MTGQRTGTGFVLRCGCAPTGRRPGRAAAEIRRPEAVAPLFQNPLMQEMIARLRVRDVNPARPRRPTHCPSTAGTRCGTGLPGRRSEWHRPAATVLAEHRAGCSDLHVVKRHAGISSRIAAFTIAGLATFGVSSSGASLRRLVNGPNQDGHLIVIDNALAVGPLARMFGGHAKIDDEKASPVMKGRAASCAVVQCVKSVSQLQ